MLESVRPIDRKKRHFMPFEAKKPRLRNTCPRCGSLNVRRRRPKNDYICDRCEWTGHNVMREMR